MVPEFHMISAIYLLSVGLNHAYELGNKIVICLRLSSE